jgi:hypothetical protein
MRDCFVCSSDNHLEQNPYVDYPEFRGDSYEALRQVTSAAIERGVPLILAGDVLEKNFPDSITLKEAYKQIDRLAAKNVPLYFIEGQHDLAPKQPWLSLHGFARPLYAGSCVRIGPFMVAGLGYTPAPALPEAMAKVSREADVLVLHQPWREFMGEHLPSDGSLAELVPPNIRMVVTGDFHVHKHLVIQRDRRLDLVVLSPGSTSLQSVKEDENKFFYAVRDDLSFYSIPLRGRSVFRQRVPIAAEAERALQELRLCTSQLADSEENRRLPVEMQMPLWVVYAHVSCGSLEHLFADASKGLAHLFFRTYGSNVATADRDPDRRCVRFSDALAKSGLVLDSSVGRAALQLWASETPRADLEAIVQDWTANPETAADVFGGVS